MQLPYGTLVSSHRGAADLKEQGRAIAKDTLTGYLRVSVFHKIAVSECVIVYLAGKPVMSFASDGTADHMDQDYRRMEEAILMDNAIVEVCRLQDRQVKLLRDLYREFAIASESAFARPATKDPPGAAPPGPEEKPRTSPVQEIRGRFVRAENIGDLDEYLQKHPGETGHLIFMAQRDGWQEEKHIILIRGKIDAAFNGSLSGRDLVEKLKGVPGETEFYAVDEALLASIAGRYAKSASLPAAEKPAHGIGIPAKYLLESSRRAAGEGSGGMEGDIAMVRKVEHDFEGDVDELLNKLELSHLRSRKRK